MNKIKNAFNKAQNKVNELAIRAKTAIQNKSGEGYIDTAVKIIIGVVIGSLILVSARDRTVQQQCGYGTESQLKTVHGISPCRTSRYIRATVRCAS